MNAEMLVTNDLWMLVLSLLVLGTGVCGFLIGYLVKNFLVDKKVKEVENALEKHVGKELDSFFKDVY